MTNYSAGHDAEKIAAEYLKNLGFTILELNWKTKYCEIDLIVEKNNTIYFVEVKYRKNTNFGTGLDYITPKKLKQMTFETQLWISENNWQGNYQLSALEITGEKYEHINFLPDL